MQKEPIFRELHSLNTGDEFLFNGQTYRVMVPLPFTVITKHRAGHTREVLNVKTCKTEKIKYFEKVQVIGNYYRDKTV